MPCSVREERRGRAGGRRAFIPQTPSRRAFLCLAFRSVLHEHAVHPRRGARLSAQKLGADKTVTEQLGYGTGGSPKVQKEAPLCAGSGRGSASHAGLGYTLVS